MIAITCFGLGVFVGKPFKVVVQDESRLKECTVIKTEYVPQKCETGAPVQVQKPESAEPAKEEPKDEKKDESPADQQRSQERKEREQADIPEDERPIEDCKAWAEKATKSMAESTVRYGDYGMENKFTFTTEEFKCIDALRAAIVEANLQIKEEAPENVGKYVYYMKVGRSGK